MSLFQLETLDSLLDKSCEMGIEIFKETGKVQPMVIGYNNDNTENYIIPLLGSTEEEQQHSVDYARLTLAAHNCDKYFIVTEGLLFTEDKAIEEKFVLNFCAVNKTGNKIRVYEMKKDKSVQKLFEDINNSQGVLTELLPNRKLTDVERKSMLGKLNAMGSIIEKV